MTADEDPTVATADRCNAPLIVRASSYGDSVTVGCERVGGRIWTSRPGATLGSLLDESRTHRDECHAGPIVTTR